MFFPYESKVQESGSDVTMAPGVAMAAPLSDRAEVTAVRISGCWSVSATFLTYSGPGISGAGPHRWIAIFTGIDAVSPERDYTLVPPNVLIVHSNQDAHAVGTWDDSTGENASFSLVMQLFQLGVWKGNLNIYAPELLIASDGKSFTTPLSTPMQVVQYDASGTLVGQATMSLEGTRISMEAVEEALPIQS